MNSRRISLVLLLVNLGLVGAIGFLLHRLNTTPVGSTAASKTRMVTNTVTQIAVRKVNATNLLAMLANMPLRWNAIESTNYAVFIANLRGIGCPEETVRDIIITDVAKLYARRRAAVRSQGRPWQFWRTGEGAGSGADPETQRQLKALDREQRALVKDLLGVDLQTEMTRYFDSDDSQERMYGFLPREKREKLQALQSGYDELEQEIYARSHGVMLAEDQEQLRRLQKQRDVEIATLLTPAEAEEYELRNSTTANNLRAQMSGFQPTEDEFRKVFQLQKVFDGEFDQGFDLSDDRQTEVKARAQQEAQQALNEEVKKIMGEQRYSEYQRAQDTDYRTLVQLSERFDIAPEVPGKIYEMKQEAERQRQKIETDPNITDEQRQRAMAAIAAETERSVAQVMGDKIFKSYRKAGGQWIQDLNTTPYLLDSAPPPLPPVPTQ